MNTKLTVQLLRAKTRGRMVLLLGDLISQTADPRLPTHLRLGVLNVMRLWAAGDNRTLSRVAHDVFYRHSVALRSPLCFECGCLETHHVPTCSAQGESNTWHLEGQYLEDWSVDDPEIDSDTYIMCPCEHVLGDHDLVDGHCMQMFCKCKCKCFGELVEEEDSQLDEREKCPCGHKRVDHEFEDGGCLHCGCYEFGMDTSDWEPEPQKVYLGDPGDNMGLTAYE